MVEIVTRPEWGAETEESPAPRIQLPALYVWLHHTVGNFPNSARSIKLLEQSALSEGYEDIEYNYLTDDNGVSYEGRGCDHKSAAQNAPGGPDNNSVGMAICALGNFQIEEPTQKLLRGIAELLVWLYHHGKIAQPKITGPHRDAPGCSTACCGNKLIARIPDINRIAREILTGQSLTTIAAKGGAVEMVRTPTGHGYYIVAADGGVFCYGDALFHGSMYGKPLAAPIVGMALMPNGLGYFLVGSDGGVFCFGASKFLGSMGGQKLKAPIVGAEYDAEGDGYWLLGADGGIFTFGKTSFYGSAAGKVKYP